MRTYHINPVYNIFEIYHCVHITLTPYTIYLKFINAYISDPFYIHSTFNSIFRLLPLAIRMYSKRMDDKGIRKQDT